MKFVLTVLLLIFSLVIFTALLFGAQFFNLFNYSFFAPKYENVRREVFQNTNSYVLGKEQELSKLRLEYMEGDKDKKAILESIIRQSFAGVDRSTLSSESRVFLNQVSP